MVAKRKLRSPRWLAPVTRRLAQWTKWIRSQIRRLWRRQLFQGLVAAAATYGTLALVHATAGSLFKYSDAVVGALAFVASYLISKEVASRIQRARMLPRGAAWWLRMRAKSPLIADGIATVFAAIAMLGLSKALNVRVSGLGGELPLSIAILIVAYLLVSQVTSLMVGTLVRNVFRVAAAAQGPARGTLLGFVDRHLIRLETQMQAILSSEGAELNIGEVRFWTEESFASGLGHYDGTDSHLPSQFVALYPNYLKAHGNMLTHHKGAPQNSRTLIGAHDAFRDDYIDHYEAGYGRFLKWHKDFDVQLWHMEAEQADRLREIVAHRSGGDPLPTTDIAVWYDQYALLFKEVNKDTVRLWMVFPGSTWYAQCQEIIDLIKNGVGDEDGPKEVIGLPLKEAVPEIFHETLCLAWEKFVNPDKRMEKLAPFFTDILKPNNGGAILDAAAGIGTDALWLSRHDYDISLNEIEPVYRKIIAQKFTGRRLRLWGHDWRLLPQEFGQFFDTLLVLGNSLCLVTNTDQQGRAVAAFYDVLRPGGRIVIDERNFAHFTEPQQAAEMMRNPVKYFPYHDRVMYCGDEVRACPKTISDTAVTFRYYSSDETFDERLRGADALDDGLLTELQERDVGALRMYPFSRGELAQLLMNSGFVNVTVYADLDLSTRRSVARDSDWYSEDADFLMYVATKPDRPASAVEHVRADDSGPEEGPDT